MTISVGADLRPANSAMITEKPTVLVVDDEPMITAILTAVLRRTGYAVLAAGSPGEAVEMCRKAKSPIALAIVDYLMPGQNGADLAASLKQLHPDMRIVMMSGYTGAELKMQEAQCEVHAFLQKPFRVETAVAVVQKVLS